jgi:hypothetical protein
MPLLNSGLSCKKLHAERKHGLREMERIESIIATDSPAGLTAAVLRKGRCVPLTQPSGIRGQAKEAGGRLRTQFHGQLKPTTGEYIMIKNILLAAVLTVSALAATHAQAANAQTGQSGFVSGGGSYEFTTYCPSVGLHPNSYACRSTCVKLFPAGSATTMQYCRYSYRSNEQTPNTLKQRSQQGFTQGKFRSH